MTEPIYSSAEHREIIEAYLEMSMRFAKELSTKSRYESYLDVIDTIIQYHNGYGTGIKENEWYSWLMIIPINLSVATNGFFAGIETKGNRTVVNSYKLILEEVVQQVADKIDKIEVIND
jgi:hypothetical protein